VAREVFEEAGVEVGDGEHLLDGFWAMLIRSARSLLSLVSAVALPVVANDRCEYVGADFPRECETPLTIFRSQLLWLRRTRPLDAI
jgi:8-oxo-dGTP pyrophosphatase MutT (NUDIX family)